MVVLFQDCETIRVEAMDLESHKNGMRKSFKLLEPHITAQQVIEDIHTAPCFSVHTVITMRNLKL